jgi:hypothetical protein
VASRQNGGPQVSYLTGFRLARNDWQAPKHSFAAVIARRSAGQLLSVSVGR